MEPNIKNRYDIILSLNISDAIDAANINNMEAAIPVVPRVFIYMIEICLVLGKRIQSVILCVGVMLMSQPQSGNGNDYYDCLPLV
ncbi:MAG: hypothetical protein K2F94_05105 [Muribaculaceae bacterium]|nr:hypothetical protein [Muribaculaceae bacterium]